MAVVDPRYPPCPQCGKRTYGSMGEAGQVAQLINLREGFTGQARLVPYQAHKDGSPIWHLRTYRTPEAKKRARRKWRQSAGGRESQRRYRKRRKECRRLYRQLICGLAALMARKTAQEGD